MNQLREHYRLLFEPPVETLGCRHDKHVRLVIVEPDRNEPNSRSDTPLSVWPLGVCRHNGNRC